MSPTNGSGSCYAMSYFHSFIHSFIRSFVGSFVYSFILETSASSRDYYSEVLPAQSRTNTKDLRKILEGCNVMQCWAALLVLQIFQKLFLTYIEAAIHFCFVCIQTLYLFFSKLSDYFVLEYKMPKNTFLVGPK